MNHSDPFCISVHCILCRGYKEIVMIPAALPVRQADDHLCTSRMPQPGPSISCSGFALGIKKPPFILGSL